MRSLLSVLLCALAVACAAPQSDPDVVARFDGGTIEVAEIEKAILGTPLATGALGAEDRDRLYRDLLGQLAIRKLLLDPQRSGNVAGELDVEQQLREARTQILVAAFLRSELELPAVAPEAVEEYFEENRERFVRPERREVYHLFLRPEEGESREQLEARLLGLRDRHLAGEPFAQLAGEYSQSQLRHGDGALGWLTPGQLPPKLNNIVFGLEEGVPSEILMTESGAHLFLAATVVDSQAASLEESRTQVHRLLQQDVWLEGVSEYLEGRERSSSDFEPTLEEFEALMAGGDPNALVARIGEWTLSAGELLELRKGAAGAGGAEVAAAHEQLTSLIQRQRLVDLAEASGIESETDVAGALANARDNLIFARMQRQVLLEMIDSNQAELEAFFASQRQRFAGPLRLRVVRLAIPLGPGSGKTMSDLEAAIPRLESGEQTFGELASAVGGVLEEAVWKSLEQLRAEGGALRNRMAAIQAGGYSEPISNGRELEVFHVLERSEPSVPVLASVKDEVVEAYLQARGESLYKAWVEAELDSVGFEILDDRLSDYDQRNVGVDQSTDGS